MPSSCIYSPSHTSPSGKSYRNCKGYGKRRKKYVTDTGTTCCRLDKHPRPATGPKCGSIEVRGRGKVPVYRGSQDGVYYLTQTNDKIYIDSKDNIHKKPKACGPGAKHKSPSSSTSHIWCGLLGIIGIVIGWTLIEIANEIKRDNVKQKKKDSVGLKYLKWTGIVVLWVSIGAVLVNLCIMLYHAQKGTLAF